MPILTNAMIDAARTERGAWTRKQLKTLGIDWPPRFGWKSRIIGKEFSEETLVEFRESATAITKRTAKNLRKKSIRDQARKMATSPERIEHLERSIGMLLKELIDDDKLRDSVSQILKTPSRQPTLIEIEYGKTLGPVAMKLLENNSENRTALPAK